MSHLSVMPGHDYRPPADRLTTREIEILSMLAKGGSTAEIASALGLSTKTVECHRSNTLRKLEVKSSMSAIALAMASGVISCSCREPAMPPIPQMTPRELQVIGLMAWGKCSKEVAQLLKLAVSTAEVHRQHIIVKLNVDSGIKAVAAAIAHRIIDCPCERAWDYHGA